MQVLFVSDRGDLLPLATRAQGSGHTVTLHIDDQRYAHRGRGLVDRRTAWEGQVHRNGKPVKDKITRLLREVKPDLVVLDRPLGCISETVRAWGAKVWGSDRWSSLVNTSTPYEQKMLDYCEFDPGDAFERLDKAQEDNGVEVYAGVWWDGSHMLYPHVAVLELGFMTDGVGVPVVGGVVVRPISMYTRLAQKLLFPLEKMLKRTSYQGPVRIGPTLSVGFDLPTHSALGELLKGDIIHTMQGERTKYGDGAALSVRVSLPPFPHGDDGKSHGKQSLKIPEEALKHTWLVDVSNGDSGGTDGNVGFVSARGTNIRECIRRVQRTIKNIKCSGDLQYRSDIGRAADKALGSLRFCHLI